MSKIVVTVPNMSDSGLSAAVIAQFRALIMDDSDLLVRLNERGLPIRLEHPTSGATIELVTDDEPEEVEDPDLHKTIDHTKAQALHARWREVSSDTSDEARYQFTRAVLGYLPRWRAGGMTNYEAGRLFEAMAANSTSSVSVRMLRPVR